MDSKDLLLKHTAAIVYADFKTHINLIQPSCISGCNISECNITYRDYQYRLLINQGKKSYSC